MTNDPIIEKNNYKETEQSLKLNENTSTNEIFSIESNKIVKKKIYSCPVENCGRQFKWLAHFKYHQKTHDGSKTYNCVFANCPSGFMTHQALKVHSRIHQEQKPFQCTENGCSKNFTTLGNLKNHIRTHTGERPFVCTVEGCKRNFAESSSLKKHSLVHSGKKPFSCEICLKRFSQIGSRNVHKRRAHHNSNDQNPQREEINNDNKKEAQDEDEDATKDATTNNRDRKETKEIASDATGTTTTQETMEMENYVMLSDSAGAEKMFTVQGLNGDCVILSQPANHLVTVTTASELIQNQEEYSYQTVLASSNANVLVLAEPQEMLMISIKDFNNSTLFSNSE